MGHDIYGQINKKDKSSIAYLRRGAFNILNNEIYNALNAQEYNANCSGCGEGRAFTKKELLKADRYLDDGDLEPEREFIADCLDNLDNNDNIYIYFG